MQKKTTGLTRRDFLKISGATGLGASLGLTLPAFANASARSLLQTPVSGGTLIEGRTYEPVDLDPATTLNTEAGQIVLPRMYESLVTSSPTLQPVAKLATSWEMTDDKTWVFKIRQGVKFHDGTPLTVDDIKATYDHIVDPKSGHPAAQFVGDAELEIVDPETIKFTLSAPNVVFPNQQHWSFIQAKADLAKGADWMKKNVNGTGPFMLKSWQPDTQMDLVKNPNYWEEGKPYLDAITMKVFPEEASAVAALQAGQIDFLTLEDPNNYPLLQAIQGLSLLTVPANGGVFWCFNGDKAPMDDVKVRQAISTAINREEVLQLVGGGLGQVSGFITPAFEGIYTPASELPNYTYDVEKAKALLKESSQPNGFKMDCLYIDTLPLMKNGAQLFKQYMEAIGIEVELRGMETNVWVDTVVNTGDFFFTTNLEIGGPTPEAIAKGIACGSAIAGFYGPCFDELDAMVTKAAGTADPAAHTALWKDIQTFVAENLPTAAWIYARNHVVGAQSWVKDFVAYPDKAHRAFDNVWLEGKPS